MKLRALAPGKVNLCLLMGGVRRDGRHEVVTVYESVSLCDELSLSMADGGVDEVVCPGVEGPNLVAAALDALRAGGWSAPPVRIEVHKRIPVAGGMAGGSADAAAALRLAAAVCEPPAGPVERVAASLGADVPSQLSAGVAIGTGAGEIVERVGPLEPHAFAIVPLSFWLSTAEVYREADRLGAVRTAGELRSALGALREAAGRAGSEAVGRPGSGDRVGGALPASLAGVNDLQPAALSLRPEIGDALDAVRAGGADGAFVSGSGPTVVGMFAGGACRERASAAAADLAARYPGACDAVPVDERVGQPSPRSGTIEART